MNADDPRLTSLRRWLAERIDGDWSLAPASADASFRRYFRVTRERGGTLIVMDAPPDREDCRPFVRVAGMLAEAGLNAPAVIDQDFERGFLLLSDLGTRTYLAALREGDAARLMDDATTALVAWQRTSRPGVLPEYDTALLERELQLFPDWYLRRHRGIEPDAAASEALATVSARLVGAAAAQPRVFVHRDYMPRNLMVSAPNPGILDFQDAVHGPITYDLASLLRDAFISWPDEVALDWSIRYWEKARRAALPVAADFGAFFRDLEWMGLQRHLKVLGIFARLAYRDHKPDYLADTPRFLGYARPVAERYDELRPLLRILDRLEAA